MQNLDGTVVATALPAMARSFGSDPLHMNVALTSYLLSLAVFIPASGWMADRYGARAVFRAAIAVFTVASVLCGFAQTLPQLVGARVLQGIGGAMMVPVGRLVLLRSVAKSELVAAMAWLTVPALMGPVVGPPLGGFLVTFADWRWVFFINVPIGVLGIVLVTRFVADGRETRPPRLDAWGLLFSGASLACLMMGFETAGRGILPPWVVAALLGVGAAAGAGYFLHARGRADPLLDFGLLREPTFAVSVLAGSLFRVGVGAIPFLLPLMLQIGFGQSAAESGLVTFSAAIGAVAMKTAAQRALRAFGFRTVLVWNAVLGSVALGVVGLFRPDWPDGRAVCGADRGRVPAELAVHGLQHDRLCRDRAGADECGDESLFDHPAAVADDGDQRGGGVARVRDHSGGRASPVPADFMMAFFVVAVVSLVAAPMARRLPLDAGAEMSGHVVAR